MARFEPGQLVHHKLYDYRGVIVRFDPRCEAEDEWYDFQTQGSLNPPTKEQPWYHVLVHGKTHTTYVAEQNLEPDKSSEPVVHPLTEQVFPSFYRGRYYREPLN